MVSLFDEQIPVIDSMSADQLVVTDFVSTFQVGGCVVGWSTPKQPTRPTNNHVCILANWGLSAHSKHASVVKGPGFWFCCSKFALRRAEESIGF